MGLNDLFLLGVCFSLSNSMQIEPGQCCRPGDERGAGGDGHGDNGRNGCAECDLQDQLVDTVRAVRGKWLEEKGPGVNGDL